MTISASTILPTQYGDIQINYHLNGDETCLSLVIGNPTEQTQLLCLLHSACIFGDYFGSQHCACKVQLKTSLAQMAQVGCGVVIYLFQEGHSVGLEEKFREHELQSAEEINTPEAMAALDYNPDPRRYDVAIAALRDLNAPSQLRLISNNPRKSQQLEEGQFNVIENVSLRSDLKIGEEKLLLQTVKKTSIANRYRPSLVSN